MFGGGSLQIPSAGSGSDIKRTLVKLRATGFTGGPVFKEMLVNKKHEANRVRCFLTKERFSADQTLNSENDSGASHSFMTCGAKNFTD